jgi:hypothetical protein
MRNRAGIVFALVVIASTVVSVKFGTAMAQSSDLGGSSWIAVNECNLDVTFNADGTAVVTYDDGSYRMAHWTMDGDALHLTYDHFYGGIEGVGSESDRGHIEATETTRNESTQAVRSLSCKLNK